LTWFVWNRDLSLLSFSTWDFSLSFWSIIRWVNCWRLRKVSLSKVYRTYWSFISFSYSPCYLSVMCYFAFFAAFVILCSIYCTWPNT
jgi:hypothetical protein